MCSAEWGPVYVKKCWCDEDDEDDEIVLGHSFMCLEPILHYTSNLDGAFSVVDKMKELEYNFTLFDKGIVRAIFENEFDLEKKGYASGSLTGNKDRCLAICLAALKCFGINGLEDINEY